jgi:hypothetical protein
MYMAIALFYLFLGLSEATGRGPIGRAPTIAYERSEGGKTTTVRLTPNRDGTTTITDLVTGDERKLNLADYTSGATLKPIYQERREPETITIFNGLLTVLLTVFVFSMVFKKDYKRYRLRRVVAVAARET